MMLKIKKFCLSIATLGPLGYLTMGGIISTLLVIPGLYFLRTLSWLNTTLFYGVCAGIFLLSIPIIHFALSYPTDKDSSIIVLDRILGFALVFIGVPFSIKFLLTGFILFTVLNFLRPFLLFRLWNFSLEDLPGVLGILSGPVLTGLVINLFFQFAAWIAH